jgi:ubiquinone/menaquinone biosynthesis C-methylase UbiE
LNLTHRLRQPEWMDDPSASPADLQASLKFIRRINNLLGYKRATLAHLEKMSRGWKPGELIRLIDLGTGSADIPLAILRWADRRKFNVHIVGVDLHAETAAIAVAAARGDARLQIVRADVLNLPFAPGSFDYALTAMFLHHLDDEQVVAVLKSMDRLSRRGVIVADLLRHRRALIWIKLFTLASTPMVRHDAAVSVEQAFTEAEVMSLRDRSGLGYCQYFRHFGHRFVLAGEKANGIP